MIHACYYSCNFNILNVVSLAEIEHPPKRPCIVPDKTKFLCENLIQPFDTLPTRAGQLLGLINAPLLAKLPMASYSDLGNIPLVDDSISKISKATELSLKSFVDSL
ncbi:2860_t:CDS:2 [Entrophospora sp. SA101]|nr:2860_t:CDS:2 [Entrophospora sp. SA101]